MIFHSEINAYLMYDPTVPAKGPFWQVKEEPTTLMRQEIICDKPSISPRCT